MIWLRKGIKILFPPSMCQVSFIWPLRAMFYPSPPCSEPQRANLYVPHQQDSFPIEFSQLETLRRLEGKRTVRSGYLYSIPPRSVWPGHIHWLKVISVPKVASSTGLSILVDRTQPPLILLYLGMVEAQLLTSFRSLQFPLRFHYTQTHF